MTPIPPNTLQPKHETRRHDDGLESIIVVPKSVAWRLFRCMRSVQGEDD